MQPDIYRTLQEQLDLLSIGYPKSESGVEIEILKKVFTVEEADFFLNMTPFLETPEAVAERTGRDLASVQEMCEQMALKGQLFRHRKGELARYAAVPFVVGFYEFQLKRMDAELADMVSRYMEESFFGEGHTPALPMRTIPVNKAVDGSIPVAAYEDAKSILKKQKRIAIAECICREMQHKTGNMCPKPKEVCFVFGSHADYYVENGMGRYIELEEALEVQDKCQEAGLVNQPFNVTNPGGMCNCCGCCCGLLKALNKHPKPVEIVLTNHQAVVEGSECAACGECEDRCQVRAIVFDDQGIAKVDPDRCIGCGLCVTTCPTEAITLKAVEKDRQRTPPANEMELFKDIAEKRGIDLPPI